MNKKKCFDWLLIALKPHLVHSISATKATKFSLRVTEPRPCPLQDTDVAQFITFYWRREREWIHIWRSPVVAHWTTFRPLIPLTLSQGRFQLNTLNVRDILIPLSPHLSLEPHLLNLDSEESLNKTQILCFCWNIRRVSFSFYVWNISDCVCWLFIIHKHKQWQKPTDCVL